MTTKVISLLIPQTMGDKISKCVVESGYGLRGKSRWVCDAIAEFLVLDNYQSLATLDNEFSELSKNLSIRVSTEIDNLLKQAVLDIRTLYPNSEGVKSAIIRASILQKMIKHQLHASNF